MQRNVIRSATLTLLLLASSIAAAVPVNFVISGTVNGVDLGNIYGLSAGDTVIATAMFDDAVIAALGNGVVEAGQAGNAFGAMLSLNLGLVTLVESNDIDYIGDIFPTLLFFNGTFTGFDFVADLNANGSPIDLDVDGLAFTGSDGLFGNFLLDTLRITPKAVPEPATLLMFLSALVLVATRRSVVPARVER